MADNKQYSLSKIEIKSNIEKAERQYNDGNISRTRYRNIVQTNLKGYDENKFSYESLKTRRQLLTANSNFSINTSNSGFLSIEERGKILSKYAEDNAAVAREYFGSEDGKLFNDKIPVNIVDLNSEPTTTDIVQTLMPIIIDLTQRCERLEKSPVQRFLGVGRDKALKIAEKIEEHPKLYEFLYRIYDKFCR